MFRTILLASLVVPLFASSLSAAERRLGSVEGYPTPVLDAGAHSIDGCCVGPVRRFGALIEPPIQFAVDRRQEPTTALAAFRPPPPFYRPWYAQPFAWPYYYYRPRYPAYWPSYYWYSYPRLYYHFPIYNPGPLPGPYPPAYPGSGFFFGAWGYQPNVYGLYSYGGYPMDNWGYPGGLDGAWW